MEIAAATTPIDVRFELPLGSDAHDDHAPDADGEIDDVGIGL